MVRKILVLAFIALMIIVSFQCSKSPSGTDNKTIMRELTALEKQLVDSDNKFGLKLMREIVKLEKGKNVFISPLSISMALGMTLNGADGSTKEAMETTLELQEMTVQEINESYKSLIELLIHLDSEVLFQIANSIWYRQSYTLEPEFLNLNKTYFDAEVEGLDFNNPSSVDIINNWVDENTNGRIKEIIKNIDPNTVMFLINAIYFKGAWTNPFDKDLTQDDLFTLPDGSQTSCKMMKQEGNFQYFENNDFQAIDLPYGDKNFSMTIFLPHANKDIDELIAQFTQENWNQWINSFSENWLILQLPRFKLKYEFTLNDVLKTLGMGIAFDSGNADFSRMLVERKDLYISTVKHKTFVEVDEEGTEAAAVTIVDIRDTALPPSMRVDRSFVFVIRENHSQTILFIGKIADIN